MERIIVEDISKKFKIGFEKNQGALARFLSFFSGKEPKRIIWALREVSFSVNTGEIVGIIGKNCAGKSTLLRIIAGIYEKDEGELITNGKIISLINLIVGLKDRLTMKDNIYLCCSIFGLTKNKIRQKFDSIVEFAELQDFVSTKLYQFSEGMLQRLSFSIAIHSDPEVLLLDEVFEVGDEDFKIKSADKIKELVKNGATALLVSHEMQIIEEYCNRVIWIDNGQIVKIGNGKEVIREYLGNGKNEVFR